MNSNGNFYQGKKVLITGHTGFKGSWLSLLLLELGAKVIGYALPPNMQPNLYELIALEREMRSVIGDVRNLDKLGKIFQEEKPEIVFHLAAQPLVLESYEQPRTTFETNVMGTVNVLECIRNTDTVRSFVNVTTDKVYENKEWVWGYRETDRLNGHDPYSNSKSCAELVTDSYRKSFLAERQIAVSTVRAGNVIGGGDFTKGRIVPDCVQAALENKVIQVRNPHSMRPYQHVLEALSAYLLVAQKQYEDIAYADCYNVGPEEANCVTTEQLVKKFCEISKRWQKKLKWEAVEKRTPVEANYLKLDSSKIKAQLQWQPKWRIETALEKVIQWAFLYEQGGNLSQCMREQIIAYKNEGENGLR